MEALYGPHEAERTMKQFVTVDYHRPIPVADGVTLTYLDAGHMLGSAQVCLDLRENGVKRRLLFSGDVGRGHNDILRDPEACEDVDYLLMESTYGGVDHETSDFADSELCAVINEAMKSQGKIIIPSFAVGRTQSVVYALHKLRETNCFPAIPIFVDSPLAVNATEVFRLHPECYNQPILDFLHQNKSPFGWSEITYIRDAQQSQQLNTRQEPMIIISSSGMCEAGRVLHHLRNNLSKSETTVLFVGYCAENTLGAKLLAGEKHVRVFGEPVEVNAQMVSLSGFSGHADHSELCTYASNVKGPKRGIHLVHGEPKRSEPLRAALTTQHPESEVRVAVQGEAWELT
jgi:metallo-beta-lactamase family protein